jgi:hypothetical protein
MEKSESKHEPGPWILGGCSGRMITTQTGYTGDGFIADVDTLANARLIAAAPDMLDVLTAIEWRDCSCGPECPQCFNFQKVGHRPECKLAAALRKARGQ